MAAETPMHPVMAFLLNHWLAMLCLLAALGLGAGALLYWRRRGSWPWEYYLPAAMLASFGLGALVFTLKSTQLPQDLLIPSWISFAMFLSGFLLFVGALAIVIATGYWSAPLGYGLTCTLFIGLGGATVDFTSEAMHVAGVFVISLRPQAPWWLLLLAAVPVLVWTSYANMISLGSTRRVLVLGFRCSLIALLTLALAETYARKPNVNVTTIFVWDRSFSMPPEVAQDRDLRKERILHFINESVARNSGKKRDDRVGVIVFGKEPRLELPPNSVTKLGFKKIHSQIDPSYTDIAGAMKLALASFPEGSGKRIVLISDGNENMGRVDEQARIAKQNGVQIDVVPIAEGRKQQNEILIERIEAPPVTEKDTRLPLRVVIRSFHPQIVVAQLNVRKLMFDPALELKQDAKERGKNSTIVKLHQGLNVYYFQQTGAKDDTVFAYEATVVPLRVETHQGALVHKDLPGDRVDNNEARVCVMTRGQRAILILEDEAGKHQLLVDRLKSANPGLKVVTLMVNDKEGRNELRNLTKGDNERLATFLSKFDAVFLANVPADFITPEEQQVIRSHVHDQGAGLVMIGGNQSFGAGGWQNTEIEKALPVNMELKSMKIEGKSGLVLIMHASEMAEGNAWQRKIAKLAIEKLSPMDMMGQIHYDYGINGGQPGHKWHINFQEMGTNRNKLMALADRMEPGDMPDVDPAFSLAYKELTNPEYKLGTKHIILISDGDHWDASQQMINKLRNSKITVTTVCITTHGQTEVMKMAAVARATGGRPYNIKNPSELPAIYIKETRLVSQSFVHEGKFEPRIVGLREGPTEALQNPLQPLHGFVRTTAKESQTVRVLIETPKLGEYKFPILAAWQYGLGKSVAFTSDARTTPGGKAYWDKDWASSVEGMYTPFWSQLSQWVLRPTETGKHLFLTTEHRDGKIRIVVETLDTDKSPLTDVEIKAGITTPAFKVKDDRKFELKFDQKNAGVWEAEIPADEVGAYFINIQAKWKNKEGKEMIDTIRSGVSIPYSPEFAEMDSNPGLLQKICHDTGGKEYSDDKGSLEAAAAAATVFRAVPDTYANLQALWPWLVFFAAICLLFDVAIRRIAIQPEALWARSVTIWQKLRGQAVADDSMTTYIERLKSRKASVGEAMDKQKAAKKYEGAASHGAPEAPIVVSTTPVEKPKPAAKKQEQKEEEADFATRLMRAKKKAMEERDKEKPK